MKDPYRTRRTLIERVKNQHDDKSWEEFVRVYQDYIYAIIRRMGISEHDADDLLQQVLINLWNNLPKMDYDDIKRFRSVLSTVTRHRVIDFMRKRGTDANRLERAGQDETLSYLSSITQSEVDAIADREWEIHLTNLAVAKVEPLFSGQAVKAFRLSLKGLSIEEISQELGLQENSVYRLRNRVKVRLIQEIAQLRKELE
ncbi:RNA polymerase sigma factor [Pontiella sulfatireligans]|uniref:ECF RNA polymerase sigma factor SigE n=1 Tax=Pontiella sulfatireligans TaxID=2750658 RepID=A0A6C2UDS2_9BACT|nr:sigma-70 family RNA polymerase sigma factor [Pontiella sulfatireligans]VGO18039.1 ECF RNA polymerase sigma factor SigE [Pontiella sulfatireligans]